MAANATPILIVDDNIEFASLLGTLFAEQGLAPLLAHSADMAMQLLERRSPLVVIVDLLLPDMTGHKLISALRKRSEAPVFVITGVFKGQIQLDKVNKITTIAGWYEKPFDTRLLVEQVMRVVGKPLVARGAYPRAESTSMPVGHNAVQAAVEEALRADDTMPATLGSRDLSRAPSDSLVDASISENGTMPVAIGGDDDDEIIEVDVDADALAMWSVVSRATEFPSTEQPVWEPSLSGLRQSEFSGSDPTTDFALKPQKMIGREPSFAASAAGPISLAEVEEKMREGGHITQPHRFSDSTPAPYREDSPVPDSEAVRARLRSGVVRRATVARLLTAFHSSRETGEIVFSRGEDRMYLTFFDGRPAQAKSKRGQQSVGLELKEAIRTLLTWDDGVYETTFKARREPNGRPPSDEHPASLVLASVLDISIQELRRLVPDRMYVMPSPNPPFELCELPLRDSAAMLLLRATGSRSMGDLIEGAVDRLDERSARAYVYGLLSLGILFPARMGELSEPPTEV